MKKKILIPKRITIETIFGCNANCPMCVINLPTKRKKGIAPLEMTKIILDQMAPYKDKIRQIDLFGLGEPLLDPHIFERIKYAKKIGFKNIGISTNADLLNEEKQKKLLESEVDTVLVSIDGVKKKTHESIRKGVNFERIIENVQSIIKKRNSGKYKTRFVIRFVMQDLNENEWGDFKKFWRPKLSKEKKDFIMLYPKNTFGGETSFKEELLKKKGGVDINLEKLPCNRVTELLVILIDGSVPLCFEDILHCKYKMGNVKKSHPIDIFNNEKFNKIRKIHLEHKKNTIKICKNCTILYSERERKIEKI